MSSPGSPRLNEMLQTAQRLSLSGRLDDAARAWDEVLRLSPDHPYALFFFGQRAMQQANLAGALALLRRAAAAAPREPMIRVGLANAEAAQGNHDAAVGVLDEALALDAYCFPALLLKASLMERMGQSRRAARLYKDALSIMPPDERLPPDLRPAAVRARTAVEENARALNAFLNERLGGIRSRHAGAPLERFDECQHALAGMGKLYPQAPTMLHFPRLPAIPFYGRDLFPWLGQIEAKTNVVRDELRQLLAAKSGRFRPYVEHPPGVPLNQWAELNNSMQWSALFLWRDGKRHEETCRLCPQTAAMLEAAPIADMPHYAPTAFFSALQADAHLPPHTGVTNARLIVHLPLIVPGPARFRVGSETRVWREGEAWVFDDTIEHEAWNDAGDLRVILIFDVWNPLLTAAERDLVRGLLEGVRDYYGDAGGDFST